MRADTPRPGAFIDRLGDADRDALLRTGRPRHYRKGESIFVTGDTGGFVLLLSSGHVKVTAPAITGTEAVLSLRGPGDLIGELSALDDGPDRRVATVVALEPVTCRVVPAADFRAVLHDHPGIALALLHMLSERLRAADRRIVEFGAYDTVRRVARLLADLAGSGEASAEADGPRPALRAHPGRPGRDGGRVARVGGPGPRHPPVARPRRHGAGSRRRPRPRRAALVRRLTARSDGVTPVAVGGHTASVSSSAEDERDRAHRSPQRAGTVRTREDRDMAQLARKRFTAIRWIAPLAFAGALGLGACGDGSGSDESVRTISPASAAAGSDVHLANQAADIAARTASVDGSDVHLVNMATDTALRTPPSSDTAYGTALEAGGCRERRPPRRQRRDLRAGRRHERQRRPERRLRARVPAHADCGRSSSPRP